jgi:hypothetical protein
MNTGSGKRRDRCTMAAISVSTTTPIRIAVSTPDRDTVGGLAYIVVLL